MNAFVPAFICPPTVRSPHIALAAQEGLADAIADSQLTVIRAPAGSGKTAAAMHWFNQLRAAGRPGLWLNARVGIDDRDTFLSVLQEAGLAEGLAWQSLNASESNRSWLAKFVALTEHKPILVIDDAHFLPGDVLKFLAQMITSAQDTITLILISPSVLDIPLARPRSLGLLVEIGSEEFRLNETESVELFSSITGVAPNGDMQQVIDEAGGWASGLIIAANCYKRNAKRRVDPAVYAELEIYFQEEVLANQAEDVRQFIVQTSVLNELTPASCAAVTGLSMESAGAMLDAIFRSNFFLTLSDWESSRYTYHPMFRKSITRELHKTPARAAELHRRASRYCAEAGQHLEAIEHANCADDQIFLGDQLEQCANDLISAGYIYRVDELGSSLPWSIISSRPMLLLALAWSRIRHLSFAAAERFINAAAEVGKTHVDAATIHSIVRHRRIMLEAARDNMAYVEEEAPKLFFELGETGPYLRCTLLAQLMSARRELYHFHDAMKLEAEARRALSRQGLGFSSISLKFTAAPTFVSQGKTDLARQLLEESLLSSEKCHGVGSGLAALPALPLAELLYEMGEITRAQELVDRYLPVVRDWGYVDQLASGYLVHARLACLAGDTVSALAGLEEAHLVAIECGFDRLRAFVVAEQVRIHTKAGHLAEAKAALLAGDIRLEVEPLPTQGTTRKHEGIAVAWLRIQMQAGNLNSAEKVATRWLEFLKRTSAIRSVVTFQLLLAQIAVLSCNRSKAQRAVRKAIELAGQAHWTQIFLDEKEWISPLLVGTYTIHSALETNTADIFASNLAEQMRGAPAIDMEAESEDAGVAAGLSSREIEILTMITGGLRNREIGERLGLTEGTVKWYLQQVYDKFGVRRRNQAVIRARQLGILG